MFRGHDDLQTRWNVKIFGLSAVFTRSVVLLKIKNKNVYYLFYANGYDVNEKKVNKFFVRKSAELFGL